MKNQVNMLTVQVGELKEQNRELQRQIGQVKVSGTKQELLNKIHMALLIHEAEVKEISQKYVNSKVFERYKVTGGETTNFTEDQIRAEIVACQNQMKQIDSILEKQKITSRYTLIMAYNDLQMKVQHL